MLHYRDESSQCHFLWYKIWVKASLNLLQRVPIRFTFFCRAFENRVPEFWTPVVVNCLKYIYDLAPSDYHLFPGLTKQLKGRHFSSDAKVGDLVGRTAFIFFFEWLAKVRATGQEVYWASWGECWINPELVAVACFLPGRDKDLSAPPRMLLCCLGRARFVASCIL